MKTTAQARIIFRKLEAQHPGADTELAYHDAFELLVATILSAQSTDRRVNVVTPALFTRYPDATAMAAVEPETLEPLIHSTGFFRAKSRSLVGMARAVVETHGGRIPASMEALVELPGVGRKTASVVLGHAFKKPALPVDRHVLRVANRIGLADSQDPEQVEEQLGRVLPPKAWTRASDTLILHGRRICRPRPACEACHIRAECRFYQGGQATARGPAPRSQKTRPPRRRAG